MFNRWYPLRVLMAMTIARIVAFFKSRFSKENLIRVDTLGLRVFVIKKKE